MAYMIWLLQLLYNVPNSQMSITDGFFSYSEFNKVLHYLKTSGTILQTALCYSEAIQSNIPKLLFLERQGLGVRESPCPPANFFLL
jgi:hypothetical protein